MNTVSPVEVSIRYATAVANLNDAWAFCMEHVDLVGADPAIEIAPVWHFDPMNPEDSHRVFNVVVSGMVENKGPTDGA